MAVLCFAKGMGVRTKAKYRDLSTAAAKTPPSVEMTFVCGGGRGQIMTAAGPSSAVLAILGFVPMMAGSLGVQKGADSKDF
jgi:lipid-binding SYLF domain-containing protein